MLATLNLGAVALGVGAGALFASLTAVVLGFALTSIGVETGPDLGLVIGILLGLATGGWVAGWRSGHSERFHGMVTGLVLAFVVVIIARLGGSPASTLAVLWQVVLAIVIAGASGWMAGRRKS